MTICAVTCWGRWSRRAAQPGQALLAEPARRYCRARRGQSRSRPVTLGETTQANIMCRPRPSARGPAGGSAHVTATRKLDSEESERRASGGRDRSLGGNRPCAKSQPSAACRGGAEPLAVAEGRVAVLAPGPPLRLPLLAGPAPEGRPGAARCACSRRPLPPSRLPAVCGGGGPVDAPHTCAHRGAMPAAGPAGSSTRPSPVGSQRPRLPGGGRQAGQLWVTKNKSIQVDVNINL